MAQTTTSEIITLIRGLIKDTLNSTGRYVDEYDSDSSFKLGDNRVSSSTITVYVNGTDITSSNWSYSSTTNKVTISSSLTAGDSILITYSYYEKYSDTEITSYITSNLTRFTQYRYKKTFYMSSGEPVSLNDEEPTKEEGYLIALVTAIDIDPQNININTRDFSISSTEKKSKSELIKDVISGFNRGFISLDFIEKEV